MVPRHEVHSVVLKLRSEVCIAKQPQLRCNSQPVPLSRFQSVLEGDLTSPWNFVRPLSRRKVSPLIVQAPHNFLFLALRFLGESLVSWGLILFQ